MAEIFTQLQNKQNRVKKQYNHHVVEVQNKSIFQPLFQKSKSFPFSFWFSHSNLLKSKDSIEGRLKYLMIYKINKMEYKIQNKNHMVEVQNKSKSRIKG